MKPSVWSSYFIDLSPEEMVRMFSKKGWGELELSDEHAAELLDRGDPTKIGKSFINYSKGYGVSFPQGHLWLYCDIASRRHEEVCDRLKKWLDLFLTLEIKNAVLHPGGFEMLRSGCGRGEILDANVRTLNVLVEYIKGTNLTICLENVPETAEKIEDIFALIEAVGSKNLGICLDTGHLNMAVGNQRDFIEKAGEMLKAIHIADNEGEWDQHLMPYEQGSVAWGEVVLALKQINFQGLFNAEIPGETKCPIPVRLAKLDYLKALLTTMIKGDIYSNYH